MDDPLEPEIMRDLSLMLLEGERLLDTDPAAAAKSARQAIAAAPSSPAAYWLLGAALREVGNIKEAKDAELAALEASALDPDLVRAGKAMMDGDFPTAEAVLRSILRQRPMDVAAIRMLAEIAASLGILSESENLLRRALKLAPGFDYARLHLADVLHRQSRPGEAVAELNKITSAELDIPETRALRASALARVGEYDSAIRMYQDIVATDPDNLEAWTSLAFLYKTIGQSDQAIASCRSALQVKPIHGEAWWMLADLKTFQFSDTDVAALEEALTTPRLEAEDRLRLHFTLGKALEDRGLIRASFDHYQAGNAIRAAQVKYEPSRTTDLVDGMQRMFTAEFLAERRGSGSLERDPIFIVGMPRSGSTLVEQILASHPMIEGTAELPDIYVLAKSLDSNPSAGMHWQNYPAVLAELSGQKLSELGRLYLDRTAVQRKTDRPLFIDKMPNNWAHVGFIQLILPNAKIIDVRRHPIPCGFSNFKQLYARGQEFTYDFEHFGLYYRDYLRLMKHFDLVAPKAIHHAIHERLVANPEEETRRLLDFVGLPFDPACLRFHESKRPVRTASAEQVRQPIRSDLTDRWRPYESFLAPLKASLGSDIQSWSDPS